MSRRNLNAEMRKLRALGHTYDEAREICRMSDQEFNEFIAHIKQDAEMKKHLSEVRARLQRESEERERQFKLDEARKNRRAKAEDKRRKVALDTQLKQIDEMFRTPARLTPRVVEKTFCSFCQVFHPTKILCSCGKIKTFSLDSYHNPIPSLIQVSAPKPVSILERCVIAHVEKGFSEEYAKNKCKDLVNDPHIQYMTANPTVIRNRKQSKEDVGIAEFVSDQNIHPELAAQAWLSYEENRLQHILSKFGTVI